MAWTSGISLNNSDLDRSKHRHRPSLKNADSSIGPALTFDSTAFQNEFALSDFNRDQQRCLVFKTLKWGGVNLAVSEVSGTTEEARANSKSMLQVPPMYHVVNSVWSWKKPAVAVQTGNPLTTDRQTLAQAHFSLSRTIQLGFGDPTLNAGAVVWEVMKNTSKSKSCGYSRYEFEIDADSEEGIGVIDGRGKLVWQRTKEAEDGVVDKWSAMSFKNYRLMDGRREERIAVFLHTDWSMTERGKLVFHKRVSQRLEVAIILTCICISEKIRRQ